MRVGVLVTANASTSYGACVPPALACHRRAFRAVCRATGASQSHESGLLAATEAGRQGAAVHEVKAQAQDATGAPAAQRRPGRPPGHPAWNKGVPHSETHRKRISMKLKQKWKDPDFRSSVTESMLGKEAWNKGRGHDADTLLKMSEAKLGKRQPVATRKLIAAAAKGRKYSEEARAEVGDRFRGKPKSPEHRSKLAAVARRRHAATRVLRAVEAVYSAASSPPPAGASGPRSPGTSGGGASGGSPPAPTTSSGAMGGGGAGGNGGASGASMGSVRAAAYSMGLTGLSDSSGKRLSRTQILNTFKSELREYRTLQEELSTWTAAFREKNNRKPNLVDVQRTGIPWLIEKFKQYVVLRDRLFSDTSLLRNKLQDAIPDPESVRSANGGASMPTYGSMGPTNANGPNAGARSAVAARFGAVMDYKMQRQARSGGAAAGTGATAASPAAAGGASASVGAGTATFRAGQQPGAGTAGDQDLAPKLQVSSQAPPRVKLAMQAALEYRQQKAHATKAAADAAAAAARLPTSTGASSAASPAGKQASTIGATAGNGAATGTATISSNSTGSLAAAAATPALPNAGPSSRPVVDGSGSSLQPPSIAPSSGMPLPAQSGAGSNPTAAEEQPIATLPPVAIPAPAMG